jgi:leucyl-tRNA synthetase
VVSTPEPFLKLVHPGIILGEDGEKMSKRWGNVVNPDDVIEQYGADALRLYEMFLGPLEAMKPWSTQSVEGITRFLDRVWRLCVAEDGGLEPALTADPPDAATRRLVHQTVKKVTEDIEGLKFNTAIAQMMVCVNELTKLERRPREALGPLILVLSPFAPHLAEELWQRLGHPESLAYEPWPAWDPALVLADTVTLAVQVNGKLRATLELPRDTGADAAREAALADERVRRYLAGARLRKVIHVPNKLLNLVAAPD